MESIAKSTSAKHSSLAESLPMEHANEKADRKCDVSDDDPASQRPKPKTIGFYLSFLCLLVMCFLVSLDATILSVAIPVMVHELKGTTLEAFWASISFMLAVVVVQPIYTSVSNAVGRIGPLYSSFCFFIVGSIVFALARNMGVLIVGRIIQGFGAGGLDVLNEIILADMTTLKERPMYIGYLSIPMLIGTILGPVLGGLFSQYVTWRWIGWINLPVSAVGLLLAIGFMRLKAIDLPFREKMRRLDWTGMALFSTGCTLFASPVVWAGTMYPWASYQTLLPLCIGAVILVVFAWYESKPVEPVFPYRIFRSRTACMALLATFLHGIISYSIVQYVPLFFQAVYFESPLHSAIMILPLCCTCIVFGILSAVAVEIIRKYKVLILISWVFAAVGAGVFTLLDRSSGHAAKAVFQIILAIGTGSLFSLPNLPLQASLKSADDMGLAAGILVSFRLFGGLIGLALCSTLFDNVFANRIRSIGELPGELAALKDVRESVSFIPLLKDVHAPPEVINKVVEAYRDSISAAFWFMAGAGAVGFLISFLIKEKSLEKEELGRQQFDDK